MLIILRRGGAELQMVDPGAGYFWLSCKTATQSEHTSTAIPAAARRLIRLHACLHR